MSPVRASGAQLHTWGAAAPGTPPAPLELLPGGGGGGEGGGLGPGLGTGLRPALASARPGAAPGLGGGGAGAPKDLAETRPAAGPWPASWPASLGPTGFSTGGLGPGGSAGLAGASLEGSGGLRRARGSGPSSPRIPPGLLGGLGAGADFVVTEPGREGKAEASCCRVTRDDGASCAPVSCISLCSGAACSAGPAAVGLAW